MTLFPRRCGQTVSLAIVIAALLGTSASRAQVPTNNLGMPPTAFAPDFSANAMAKPLMTEPREIATPSWERQSAWQCGCCEFLGNYSRLRDD